MTGGSVSAETVAARMALLDAWLRRRLDADACGWLDAQVARVRNAPTGSAVVIGIGMASRRLGKAPLQLDADELQRAAEVRPGLDPRGWSVDQAARMLFVLARYHGAEDSFAARLDALMRSAEIGEQIALLRGLPLYPQPADIVGTACEGIRSAMQPVFEAVAHASPYPAEEFSEAMWNQMVVKTLFIGSRLAPIQHLDERRNAELARMLVDYAHERWAAKRPVSPELWRCVGPYAAGSDYADLVKVFRTTNGVERKAAALALAECPSPDALVVLESAPSLWSDIRSGRITWDNFE